MAPRKPKMGKDIDLKKNCTRFWKQLSERKDLLGHMVQMDWFRLNKQIFRYITQLLSLNGYIKKLKEEMMSFGNACMDKKTYRNKILRFSLGRIQEKNRQKKRNEHSTQMRDFCGRSKGNYIHIVHGWGLCIKKTK